MEYNDITERLQSFYRKRLIRAVVAIVIAAALKMLIPLKPFPFFTHNTVMIITATLSAVTAIALPILYRSYFVDRIKGRKRIGMDEFLSFEQNTISIALATPYLLALAILTGMNRVALMMITFFTLYAVYFFFPSAKKIGFEMKFFRLLPVQKKKKR